MKANRNPKTFRQVLSIKRPGDDKWKTRPIKENLSLHDNVLDYHNKRYPNQPRDIAKVVCAGTKHKGKWVEEWHACYKSSSYGYKYFVRVLYLNC